MGGGEVSPRDIAHTALAHYTYHHGTTERHEGVLTAVVMAHEPLYFASYPFAFCRARVVHCVALLLFLMSRLIGNYYVAEHTPRMPPSYSENVC